MPDKIVVKILGRHAVEPPHESFQAADNTLEMVGIISLLYGDTIIIQNGVRGVIEPTVKFQQKSSRCCDRAKNNKKSIGSLRL